MTTAMQAEITRIVTAHGQLAEFGDVSGHPEFSLYIVNEPWTKLVIERLYADDHGCQVVSVAHTKVQNGDVMHDPEMCFDFKTWEPLYYKNDWLGLEQYVFTSPERKAYRPRLRQSLRSFSVTWAANLHAQGFDNPESAHVEQ